MTIGVAMQPNRELTGPRVLDGVRVLDFTSVIAGPYCTRLMTDMGAEVLKVEPPGGEFARHVPPMRQGVSAVYSQLNCGKRSLSLDLKHAAAVDIIKRLVVTYDVVVENFSPGVMARLGLDYQTLAQVNPALIMCSISGYGQTGPAAKRPAYAPVVQAESGFEQVYLQYQPHLERPLNMGPPVADTTASLQALGAINAALFYRLRTGQGQHIDIAMFDAILSTFPKEFQQHHWPSTPDRLYGPFDTRDGFILVLPLNQKHFESLAACMRREDLLGDPRFATTTERLANYQAFTDILAGWLRPLSSSDALAKLEAAHIPCAKYRTVGEAADDPQLVCRGMIAETQDAAGKLRVPNSPFLFSHTQAAVQPWVATVGQHNREILGSALGYSVPVLDQLESDGVLCEGEARD